MAPDQQRAALVATLMGEWDDAALVAFSDAQVDCAADAGR
jgi:hypothetical protein